MEERSVWIQVAAGDGGGLPELQEQVRPLFDALAERGGVVQGSADGQRYSVRLSVRAPDHDAAVAEAIELVREATAAAGLPEWPVVQVEAPTLDELEQEHGDHDVPELVGLPELAELLSVTPERAAILARSKGFPAPVAELQSGPVWSRPTVESYLKLTR